MDLCVIFVKQTNVLIYLIISISLWDILIFCATILMPLIYFSCLVAQFRTSSALRETVSTVSPLDMMVALGL